MSSAYSAISFLKQSAIPEKDLRKILSYLSNKHLKEYL